MIPSHNSSRFTETWYGTSSHPAINIVDKDTIGIENVVTSPSLQKTDHQNLLALSINSGLFWNQDAPIAESSPSQRYCRLHQRVVFNFLKGHGEVENLPCSENSDNKKFHGLSQTTSSLEKNHQEVIQIPDQKSIFNFFNGDVFQYLIFLVDFDFESNFGWDACEDLSRCLSQLDLKNPLDESACLDNMRQEVQNNGPCSIVSHKLQLTDHLALEHLTADPTAKMNGFTEVIDGNIHSECSFSTANPFFDSPLHYYEKTFNGVKVSDNLIDVGSESNQNYLIENLSGMLSKSNCDAEIFEQTTTTYQKNVPDFCHGNSVDSTFAIPDPEKLLEYLHGDLRFPKFLPSDSSSHLGYCSSDEAAESDNLSGFTTNASLEDAKNDNKSSSESGIKAMTGAFEETETHAIQSLPEQSQNEKVRWNWANRNVDSSWFDFGDHEDLLELYGLSDHDEHVYEDNNCESPTWPGKQ